MLDMEDSSFLDEQITKHNPIKPEIAIVSSKQVPITKLDLNKVTEIQKMQAAGSLPPLEDSQIINKQEIK